MAVGEEEVLGGESLHIGMGIGDYGRSCWVE